MWIEGAVTDRRLQVVEGGLRLAFRPNVLAVPFRERHTRTGLAGKFVAAVPRMRASIAVTTAVGASLIDRDRPHASLLSKERAEFKRPGIRSVCARIRECVRDRTRDQARELRGREAVL